MYVIFCSLRVNKIQFFQFAFGKLVICVAKYEQLIKKWISSSIEFDVHLCIVCGDGGVCRDGWGNGGVCGDGGVVVMVRLWLTKIIEPDEKNI